MKTVERTITVDRPLSRVWEYLSDFTTTTEWEPATVKTVRTSGDGGVGTTFHNTSRFLGRQVEVVYTVQEYEPQRRLQLEGKNKNSATLTDTITFTGDETRTTVTYHAVFDLHGLAKLADPVLPLTLKRLGDEAAKNMRDALERL